MEQRLSLVTLGVADLEQSRHFYEDGLGWRRGNAHAEVVFFQLGGAVLALFARSALAADAGLPAAGSGFGGIALAYNARSREEVDAVLAEAKAAGATILKPAQDAFWGGYSGYFADPDGHPWEVAWNPDWTLAEDGSISLGKTSGA
ncbi:MAG: putative Glyoxalase/bleomycin resistance protein/dioxygenase [Geminicoccaceae bacterium]|jgi:catechol 2,3-dioxygenase-like lactoylglutathione lyase family enzyme|nr:putative Glyoxalase/bleomycin resistance protein/dioxygenase [Geminicoccaceae bacterium]